MQATYSSTLSQGVPIKEITDPNSDDQRIFNVVIHGLEESISDPGSRKILNELLEILDTPFDVDSGNLQVLRLGFKKAGYHRPLKVKFQSTFHRNCLFKQIRNLQNADEKFTKVRISDDLCADELRFREDLQCLKSLCTDLEIDSKIKNDKIIINDTLYTRNTLHLLPPEYSMEKAKTREVDEGRGIAFQGPYSYLSNMSTCKIAYNQNEYTSVEQGYAHQKALCMGATETARKIISTTDPYIVKDLAKQLTPSSRKWDTTKDGILYNLMQIKFENNVELKDKLLATGKLDLYEATRDKHFGCGYLLKQKKDINAANPNLNQTGKWLMLIRSMLEK